MSKAFDFLLDEKNAKELVSSIPYADYIGMKIPNDFIVGYGLDYNGYGRNYPEIYKIIE